MTTTTKPAISKVRLALPVASTGEGLAVRLGAIVGCCTKEAEGKSGKYNYGGGVGICVGAVEVVGVIEGAEVISALT